MQIQAYRDDQLSVKEIIELESRLSPEEKKEIEGNKRFDIALTEILTNSPGCPEGVWKEVKSRVRYHAALENRSRFWRIPRLRLFAIAACITTFIFLISFWSKFQPFPKLDVTFSENLEQFSKEAEIHGDRDIIQQSLQENGFMVKLVEGETLGKHTINPLGLRFISVDGKKVAQIYYSCCNKPITIFLLPKSIPKMEKHLRIHSYSSRIYQVTDEIERYKVHALGPHPSDDILGLFT